MLHVSAVMSHHQAGGTTKVPPLMCFYTRPDVGPLGSKHVAYLKQIIVLQ